MRRGQGEGSIFYRKDRKRWIAQMTLPDGTQRSKSARTRAEARELLQELFVEIEKGEALVTGDARLTLGAYLDQWYELKHRDWPSYRTRAAAKNNLRRVTDEIGAVRLAALNEKHFRDLMATLEQKFAPQTIHLTWHELKRALDAAVEDGLISKNPIGRRLHPPQRHRSRMGTLTDEQVEILLRHTRGTRWHAMWVLMATRGLRPGEARGLTWDDVEWERRLLHIRRQGAYEGSEGGMVFAPPKTASSRRPVWLPSICVRALREHQAIQDAERSSSLWQENGLIFPNLKGRILHVSYANHYLKRDLESAGLPHIPLHGLRHTAATLLSERGVNPVAVAHLLGHASTRTTTEQYIHVSPELQRLGRDIIDRMFPSLDEDAGEGYIERETVSETVSEVYTQQ